MLKIVTLIAVTYLLCFNSVECYKTTGFSFLPQRPLVLVAADAVRVFLRVTRPISDAVLDMVYSLVMGKTKELPPIENKLLLMSATELAHKIRRREVSSEAVVRAYVERSKAIHPLINAVVDERYDEALEDAREVDRFLASTHQSEEQIARDTPLLGLPFTCKEGIGVKGLSMSWGVVRYRNYKASVDGTSTTLYRKAGAIPLTVTNVPELMTWWESANKVDGQTKNPYDNRRSVGGSTGGEAALITSAGALFGIGNDLAGSIRIPCSFNGIYGHKSSKGLVPNDGDIPFKESELFSNDDMSDSFVSTGPMCRYAEDLPLLQKVLSKYDTRVPFDKEIDFKGVKVYYMEELPGYLQEPVPEVREAIQKAVAHFESQYGTRPTKLDFPEMRHATDIWESKLLESGITSIKGMMAGPGKKINLYVELIKHFVGRSEHTLPAIYYAIIERRNKDESYREFLKLFQDLERKFNETFDGKDAVLLIPTHPEPPPHYLMTIPKYANQGYTMIFAVLGLPSTNIPAGLSDKGLPFGIQAVSGRFGDHLCLATALELDKVFHGWRSPGPIRVK